MSIHSFNSSSQGRLSLGDSGNVSLCSVQFLVVLLYKLYVLSLSVGQEKDHQAAFYVEASMQSPNQNRCQVFSITTQGVIYVHPNRYYHVSSSAYRVAHGKLRNGKIQQ